MRTRSLALVVPALILAAGACGQEREPAAGSPPAAPTAPATSAAPVPAPSTPAAAPTPTRSRVKAVPSRKPALAGPRTVCGEIQPPGGGPMAVVAVHKGRADCVGAVQTFRTYYRKSTPKQGTAGIATVGGWHCASNTVAQAATTGRLASCRNGTATIVADVIP
ncbi:hypothetical protein ACIBF1_19485 [Spirillospora sp. NPDC050679]